MGEHVTIRCCIQMFGQPVQRLALIKFNGSRKKGGNCLEETVWNASDLR